MILLLYLYIQSTTVLYVQLFRIIVITMKNITISHIHAHITIHTTRRRGNTFIFIINLILPYVVNFDLSQ